MPRQSVTLDPFAGYYLDRFMAALRDPESAQLDLQRDEALAMLLESAGVDRTGRAHGRRHRPRFERKPCVACGAAFQPTGGRSLVCIDCRA